MEAVAHRWGLIIVPSVLGLFDGDHAARLYHSTWFRYDGPVGGPQSQQDEALDEIVAHIGQADR